jgi:hypothetical protein
MNLPGLEIFVLLKEVQVHLDLRGLPRKENISEEKRVSTCHHEVEVSCVTDWMRFLLRYLTNLYHIGIGDLNPHTYYVCHHLEMAVNLKKKTFTFSAPNDLPNNLLKYCTRALNHSVYFHLNEGFTH